MRLCEALDQSILDAAAKQLINDIDWSGGDGETVMHMIGHDPDDGDPSEDEIMAWAKERVEAAESNIEYRFKDGHLPIYRMITAPADWKSDPNRHPGIYWSWDETAADAHWGSFANGQVQWMLYAEVTADQINWVDTLAANGDASLGENEREITLYEHQPVKILKYWRVGR
jgi:hypothetical protein